MQKMLPEDHGMNQTEKNRRKATLQAFSLLVGLVPVVEEIQTSPRCSSSHLALGVSSLTTNRSH